MTITLLSDLGVRDATVTIAKAILAQHAPAAVVADVTHCVARDDVQQAAYLLLSAYRSFEKGSVHIVAVDVFCGEAPRMLLIKKEGSFIIAPDNGLLPLAFGNELENTRLCFEYRKPYSFNAWMHDAGSVVAAIEQGWVLPYRQCQASVMPKARHHQVTPYGLECNILYIDRYKNVVLDITRKQFEKLAGGRPFTIGLIKDMEISSIHHHYNEVDEGKPLCRFNRAGYMEIGINQGEAAASLGLHQTAPADLKYKVMRIFF